MRRRRLLALTGAALTASLGGCAGDGTDRATQATTDPDGVTTADAGRVTTVPAHTDERVATTATRTPDATETSTPPTAATETTPSRTTTAAWPSGSYADYETTTVQVLDEDGEQLGTITAAVADTPDRRYLGLSDAPSLPEDAGMLFVFGAVDDRTFVMRRMDFGIDIVYADAAGTITTIHNAPAPGPDEDGSEQRYPGTGQYVLEANYEWTDRHGVGVGDTLDFEL